LHASVVQLIMDEDKEDNYCPHWGNYYKHQSDYSMYRFRITMLSCTLYNGYYDQIVGIVCCSRW
jgi:hypothetical protein